VVSCATLTALVVGRSGPIEGIYYVEPEADDPTDSGFGLLRSDAPPELTESTPCELVCFDCVLDEWPGIAAGLELAREHGEAGLVGGEWRIDRPQSSH
jgi:hypothetical protein